MKVICYACGRGEYPENTIEAIAHCQNVNKEWWIEMDIQITKDNRIVLFHDNDLFRITGKNGSIDGLMLPEVKQLNAGVNFKKEGQYPYRNGLIEVPLLEEVFQRFPNAKLVLDIHTKNKSIIEQLILLIEKYQYSNQVIIVSKYNEIIKSIKKKRPLWVYGAATKEAKNLIYSSFLLADGLFPVRSNILMVPEKFGKIKVLTKRIIKHIKRRKKEIWVWKYEGNSTITINTKEEYMKMKYLSVDGIFTEVPKKLYQELIDHSKNGSQGN